MTWKLKRFMPKATKAEMRFFFKGLKQAGIPFQTQKIVQGVSGRNYRVDGLVAPNIIIEIKGASHLNERQRLKDELREEDLRKNGYIIISFWNSEVYKNLGSCVQTVKRLYGKQEHL